MSKANSQTLTVRLPTEIAQNLMKLRNEKNLSTIGSALKFWMEQQLEEQRETKLLEINENLEGLHKSIDKVNRRTFGLVYGKVMDDLTSMARGIGLSNEQIQDYFELHDKEIMKLIKAYPPTKDYCSLLSELREGMKAFKH